MIDVEKLILDRARSRFERFGYKKTTMDEISRDCRISKKTVYACFRDKENLFLSLLLHESRLAQEYIFGQIREIADPVEKLKKLLKTAVEYFNQDHFLTRILKDEEALYSPVLHKKYRQEVEESLIPAITGILAEGQKRGRIRDIDVNVVAYAGLKLFQSFSYLRTRDFYRDRENPGYSVDVLIDLIMHGLESTPESSIGSGGWTYVK
ncbi:MAG TPA: TetR/AcrR family transcriptional regulator [Negativicutes bacterium]|nr:TetR/AcrR family transcriptional regulator [Negativicutes bacterium]